MAPTPNDGDGNVVGCGTSSPLLIKTIEYQINGSAHSGIHLEHENENGNHTDKIYPSLVQTDCEEYNQVKEFETKDTKEKDANSLEKAPLTPTKSTTLLEYRVYPERWWLLAAVLLLNIANYAHWVAFPVVAKTAAKYYDQPGDRMDLIPTLSYGLGVPCCLLATYVVERHGLKNGLQIGGFLTGIGGLLCFLSSFTPLSKDLSSETRYLLALVGQALTGIACPFIACVPTKISQHWFADEQRSIATSLLGLSGSMGCIFGLSITPQFVHEPKDITTMNTVWFVPAALGSLLTMWKVRSNYPLLPPSPSAANIPKVKCLREWAKSIQTLFTNRAFIIIFVVLGACMGCLSSVMTKMAQMLCSRGYTDQLSGLAAALIFACATISAVPIGLLAYRVGSHRSSLICKAFIGIGIVGVATAAYFMRYPNQTAGIIISCIVMGGFAAGAYPLALELVVECTYPIDQATSTAFIFLSSALQGVILMGLENILNSDLDDDALDIQTCVSKEDHGHQQPRDYSAYLNALAIYCWAAYIIFVVGFHSEMKRSDADKLTLTTESPKQEIAMSLEPSVDDPKAEKNEFYIIKKDKENNVEIIASNGPDAL